MTSTDVIRMLKHLLHFRPEGFVLVWDHASIHTSHATQEFLKAHPEILVEELPPYAPDLNPEEYCHGNVKRRVKNATPATSSEMRHLLRNGFCRVRRRPDLMLSFFHAAGLAVRQLRLL